MNLIELNDWQDECYQTVRVRAYVREFDSDKDPVILECDYSKQFNILELVSDISYKAGNTEGTGSYVYMISVEGIDRV